MEVDGLGEGMNAIVFIDIEVSGLHAGSVTIGIGPDLVYADGLLAANVVSEMRQRRG